MMKTKLRSLLYAILLAAAVNVSIASAQTTTSATVSDPLAALPASDMVVYADVRKILTDAVPRLLAKQPQLLGQMMGALNEVKTKTGINILAIDRIAMGARILGPLGPNFKKESVGVAIIAHGDFDASALVEFAKRETRGKISEQSYGGKTIYHEPMPEPPRTRAESATPAFAVLDPNTLVVGDLPQVRATIDALAGTGRVDSALIRHATQDSNALVGMALKFSPTLADNASGGSVPDEAARGAIKFLMATLKELFGSIGSTPTSFNTVLGVRFCDAEQAQAMSEMLIGARKQFGSSGPPPLRGLLESLQISAQGSDLLVRADFKDEIVQEVVNSIINRPKHSMEMPPHAGAATPPAKVQPPKPKRRTTRRRRRG